MGYGIGHYGHGGYGILTQTTTVTITLEEQAEITVRVNDGAGAAVVQADVELEDSTGSVVDSGQTDEIGQIVFSGHPVADYTVTASKTGYFSSSVAIESGDFT